MVDDFGGELREFRDEDRGEPRDSASLLKTLTKVFESSISVSIVGQCGL